MINTKSAMLNGISVYRKKNPKPYKYSILTVHANGGYTHWVLFYNDKYYDPEFGLIEGEYTYGKITSFLEIYEN